VLREITKLWVNVTELLVSEDPKSNESGSQINSIFQSDASMYSSPEGVNSRLTKGIKSLLGIRMDRPSM
jgi:hypothetical protein